MQLSEQAKGDLIRLFSDEGMVDALGEVCKSNCEYFKGRSYRAASSANPDLIAISQDACKALAFEEMPGILRSLVNVILEKPEGEDVTDGQG